MDAGGGARSPTPATGSGTEATAPGTEAKIKELETAMKALASERKFKDAQKIKLEIAALRAPSLDVVPASSAPLENPAEGVPPVAGGANIPVPLSTGATIFVDEWVPGAGNAQWGKLLESIPQGASREDWAASLGAFRGSRPMYVLTTRFVEPWGSGAHLIKMKAEAGVSPKPDIDIPP